MVKITENLSRDFSNQRFLINSSTGFWKLSSDVTEDISAPVITPLKGQLCQSDVRLPVKDCPTSKILSNEILGYFFFYCHVEDIKSGGTVNEIFLISFYFQNDQDSL